jgi:peptide/nickel transport system permease protein
MQEPNIEVRTDQIERVVPPRRDLPGPNEAPTLAVAGTAADRETLRSTPGYYTRAWRTFRKDKLAIFSLILCVILLLFSFGAPIIAWITGQDYATNDLRNQLLPWFTDRNHILGTDPNGRDILVRLAYGGRVSMTVAVLALIVALLLGLTLGAVAGFYGGWVDSVIMRFVDVIISIPSISLLLIISVWWRPGRWGWR